MQAVIQAQNEHMMFHIIFLMSPIRMFGMKEIIKNKTTVKQFLLSMICNLAIIKMLYVLLCSFENFHHHDYHMFESQMKILAASAVTWLFSLRLYIIM